MFDMSILEPMITLQISSVGIESEIEYREFDIEVDLLGPYLSVIASFSLTLGAVFLAKYNRNIGPKLMLLGFIGLLVDSLLFLASSHGISDFYLLEKATAFIDAIPYFESVFLLIAGLGLLIYSFSLAKRNSGKNS